MANSFAVVSSAWNLLMLVYFVLVYFIFGLFMSFLDVRLLLSYM